MEKSTSKSNTDLVGRMFGQLTVVKRVPAPTHLTNQRAAHYACKCNCGTNVPVIRGTSLTSGKTTSCGCYRSQQVSLACSYDNAEDAKMASAKSVYGHCKNEFLTFEQFYSLSQQNCFYCDMPPANSYNDFAHKRKRGDWASDFSIANGTFVHSGLDRANSDLGYEFSNVVPCCKTCNRFKLDIPITMFVDNISNLQYSPSLVKANAISFIRDRLQTSGLQSIARLFPLITDSGAYFCETKISNVRQNAYCRDLIFELTRADIIELICYPCAYCNRPFDPDKGYYNGIDRVDNAIGYIVENCVSCCRFCNAAKNTLSLDDFLQWVKKIKDHLPLLKEKIANDARFTETI
jgi:hypothetical protein